MLKILLRFILLYTKCLNISVDQYLLLNLFLIICDEICGCVPLKYKGFFHLFSAGIANDGLSNISAEKSMPLYNCCCLPATSPFSFKLHSWHCHSKNWRLRVVSAAA